MIHGQLDYCNSFLYGTSAANLNKLRTRSELRSVNRKKDQTFRPRNSDPCRTTLVAGQVAVTVYKILTMQEPSSLTDVISFHVPSCHLRYCKKNCINLVFTDRLFSQAAPTVWNNLPQHVISDLSTLTSFKRLLKTELYNRAYPC